MTAAPSVASPQSTRWSPQRQRSPGRETGASGRRGASSGSERPSGSRRSPRSESSSSRSHALSVVTSSTSAARAAVSPEPGEAGLRMLDMGYVATHEPLVEGSDPPLLPRRHTRRAPSWAPFWVSGGAMQFEAAPVDGLLVIPVRSARCAATHLPAERSHGAPAAPHF